ncbi:MAG: diacylglycerol/lipid kinase family protein, partial [Acidimicrobiales bacterium]
RTVMLERGDDLAELAEEAVNRGADALGMAGGDGSLGVVAGVAARHDIPFFCVPVGTRNHFALDLGLDREDPLGALDAISDGVEISVDSGSVGGRTFLNNVSLGLYPAAVKEDGYRDAKIATFLAVASSPKNGDGDGEPEFRFRTPDGRTHRTSPMVLVSNNPYNLAGPPDFGRRVRLDAGVLGISALVPADDGRRRLLELLHRPAFQEWVSSGFRVESDSATIDVGVDGESIPIATPLEIKTNPRSLRVLIPRDARPGFRPPLARQAASLDHLVDLSGEPDT